MTLLVLAWMFALKYDTQRFLMSLPEVPPEIADATNTAEEPKPAPTDTDADVVPSVSPGALQTPAATEDLQEMLTEDSLILPQTAAESTGIDEIPRDDEVEIKASASDGDAEPSPAFEKLCENCSASRQDWRSLSADELHEYRRQDLIKRFGDIREVHIFMDTGRRMQRSSVSLETALEYVEAVATLFPDPANDKIVEELRAVEATQRKTSEQPEKH